MLSILTSFIDGERLSNFVCSFLRHMSVACNPLQPSAACVHCWAATCCYAVLCVYIFCMYFMHFRISWVSQDRNFCKFLCLFYMLLSVACNPQQPFRHPSDVRLYTALYVFSHMCMCLAISCVCLPLSNGIPWQLQDIFHICSNAV